MRVIKLKEIYEMLESVTDRCEDVANVLESIVLERAELRADFPRGLP